MYMYVHVPIISNRFTYYMYDVYNYDISGFSKWAGTFTRLRSCIVPVEITEPLKISGGQNHKYDGR